MNRLILSALVVIMCGLVSCKSHQATVVRPGAPTATRTKTKTKTASQKTPSKKKVNSVPKGAASKSEYNNDKKVSDALVRQARGWIGTPYRYGGDTKKGTDCSGLVKTLFYDVAQLSLPRNSAEQCDYCFDVPMSSLQPGDLVFFSSSTRGGKVTHVGLYVGNGKMIHASASKGVIESGLDEKYFQSHYHSSGRVYGITYAARGKRGQQSPDQEEVLLASNGIKDGATSKKSDKTEKAAKKTSDKPKESKPVVHEVTLEEYVEMSKGKSAADTIIVEEIVIEETVVEVAAESTTADSVRTAPRQPKPESVKSEVSESAVPGPKMKVNGKIVEATPAAPKPTQKRDSVPADSVRRADEIRENVVKAMKFGK